MNARWILIGGGALLIALAAAPDAGAAAGELDPAFGDTGVVTLDGPGVSGLSANDVVVTRAGTAVAAGTGSALGTYAPGAKDVFLTGITGTGTFDESFGDGGHTSVDEGANDAASSAVLQSDGRIVAVGTNAVGLIWLTRFHGDGTLDTSFGKGGTDALPVSASSTRTTKFGLAVDGTDRILVATADSRGWLTVMRRLADGGADPSFSGDGIDTPPEAIATTADSRSVPIAALPDRRVVVGLGRPGGYTLFRYTSLGRLDGAFGHGGIVSSGRGATLSDLADLAVQPNGDVVVAGWINRVARDPSRTFDYPVVARFNTRGNLDRKFGDDGRAKLKRAGRGSSFEAIVLAGQGRIVAVGTSRPTDGSQTSDVLAARFLPSGKLDRTFSDNGFVTNDVFGFDGATGVALAPDGKIVVSASTGRGGVLLRYLSQ